MHYIHWVLQATLNTMKNNSAKEQAAAVKAKMQPPEKASAVHLDIDGQLELGKPILTEQPKQLDSAKTPPRTNREADLRQIIRLQRQAMQKQFLRIQQQRLLIDHLRSINQMHSEQHPETSWLRSLFTARRKHRENP